MSKLAGIVKFVALTPRPQRRSPPFPTCGALERRKRNDSQATGTAHQSEAPEPGNG